MTRYITRYVLDFRHDLEHHKTVLAGLERMLQPYIKQQPSIAQITWSPYCPCAVPPPEGGIFVLEREWQDPALAQQACDRINRILSRDPRAKFCGSWVFLTRD